MVLITATENKDNTLMKLDLKEIENPNKSINSEIDFII